MTGIGGASARTSKKSGWSSVASPRMARHREGERIGHARAGEVLDPDRELAGLLRPVSRGGELAGQRRARGLLAQQVPAGQRQPGRFGQLRDQGDLGVDRLEVHELVGSVDPPYPAEHGGDRLPGGGGQLDGPGAQPQPLRAVLRRRERGHPGADGVEFRGRVTGRPGRGHGGRRVGVGGFHVADFGQCRGPLGEQPRPPRGGAVRIGQRPVAQPEQRHRDLVVPDAAHHQRRVGEEVKPPGGVRRRPRRRPRAAGSRRAGRPGIPPSPAR